MEGKAGAIEGKTKIRIIEARRLFDFFNTVATAGAGILWARRDTFWLSRTYAPSGSSDNRGIPWAGMIRGSLPCLLNPCHVHR